MSLSREASPAEGHTGTSQTPSLPRRRGSNKTLQSDTIMATTMKSSHDGRNPAHSSSAAAPPDSGYAIFDRTSAEEWDRNLLKSLRLSRGYILSCIAAGILAVVLLVWSIHRGLPRRGTELHLFLGLETVLVGFITLETLADMIVLRRDFWRHWIHYFDLFVVVLSCVTLALDYLNMLEAFIVIDDLLTIPLLIIRYCAQVARIFLLIRAVRERQEQQQAAEEVTITFDGKTTESSPLLTKQSASRKTHQDAITRQDGEDSEDLGQISLERDVSSFPPEGEGDPPY